MTGKMTGMTGILDGQKVKFGWSCPLTGRYFDTWFKFIHCISKEYNYWRNVMKKHFSKNLVMTAEQNEEFKTINICWVCGKLIDIGDNKVRDHCHISGKYRESTHWSCNINLKISKNVPVIFHNLKGYDSHLIFKELSKFNCKISVIPNGLENYTSFTLNNNIVFIDYMLFMKSSLDKLVKNVGSEDLKHFSDVFSGEELELVEKKGVYPYEYFNSFKKFKEINLPDTDKFFSSLKDFRINEKEYQRACNVWKVFKIKNLAEYHDLYIKTDILLLCDIFEKFIGICLKDYGLDPCHYCSSPGLSWDAMLKMTGIQLEKINNIDVHLFIQKGMRGGISYISKRHAVKTPDNTIMYIGGKGKYVVHYENLKYYFSLGMKLIKIHRILSFKQSSWLKKYVYFNTKKRQESRDEFNKSLYKFLNNCIYGKI